MLNFAIFNVISRVKAFLAMASISPVYVVYITLLTQSCTNQSEINRMYSESDKEEEGKVEPTSMDKAYDENIGHLTTRLSIYLPYMSYGSVWSRSRLAWNFLYEDPKCKDLVTKIVNSPSVIDGFFLAQRSLAQVDIQNRSHINQKIAKENNSGSTFVNANKLDEAMYYWTLQKNTIHGEAYSPFTLESINNGKVVYSISNYDKERCETLIACAAYLSIESSENIKAIVKDIHIIGNNNSTERMRTISLWISNRR